MPEESLLRPADGVVFRELDGQTVLVHLGRDRIYALNSTGSRFWQLLVEGRDRGQIRSALLEEFEVEPAALDAELSRLIGELTDAELVV